VKNELIYFAIKFCVIAAVLLAIFNFAFPYYRDFVKNSVGLFSDVTSLHTSDRIYLTFMPYVSLSALVLATPRRSKKDKAKFMALIFALFYLIDVSFSILQIILQGTPIKYYHILVVQDFFTIALPIVIWFLLYYKDLIYYQNQLKS
jgi:hypothetical protein